MEWWEEHPWFRLPALCFEIRAACLPALPSLGALWSSRNELSAHLQFTLFAETITLFPNQVLWNMPKAPFLIYYDGHDSRQVLKQNYPKWGKRKHQRNSLLEKVLLQYLMKCHKMGFITKFSTEVYTLELISEFRSTGNMSIHGRSFETFEKVPYINKSELETFFLW